jgi:hypothetical protein
MGTNDAQSCAKYQEEERERSDLRDLFGWCSICLSGTRRTRAILPLRIFAGVAAQTPSARW